GVALRPLSSAAGLVLRDREVWIASLCAPCVDHGALRRTASRLSSIYPRSGGFSRSAAECFAPAFAGGSAHHANPEVADEESSRLARGDAEKRTGEVCRILEAIGPRFERRPELRFRQQGQARVVVSLRIVWGSGETDNAEGLCRANEIRTNGDLLH